MPRKFITQEVKDQNRESQRRSRARRIELINDLKKQVEDYQRQGASASLEMQRTAQAVTLENQRLRSLLNVHGVSQEEIHRYVSCPPAPLPGSPNSLYESRALRCKACGSTSITLENPPPTLLPLHHQSYQTPSQITAACALPSPSTSFETVEPSKTERNVETGISSAESTSPQSQTIVPCDPCAEEELEKAEVQPRQPQQSIKRPCCGPRTTQRDTQQSDKPSELHSHLTTNNYIPNSITPETSDATDSMETSCDTAASILVDLHHRIDTEQARAALGCKGSGACSVSNIKIFQLLENVD